MMKEYVSYIVFEGEMTRLERIIKRLWVLCIILFIALLTTNYVWLSHTQKIITITNGETERIP